MSFLIKASQKLRVKTVAEVLLVSSLILHFNLKHYKCLLMKDGKASTLVSNSLSPALLNC